MASETTFTNEKLLYINFTPPCINPCLPICANVATPDSKCQEHFNPEKFGPGDQYSTKKWSSQTKIFMEF